MATTKQTHMIAGRMVEFQEKFSTLSNDDAQFIIQNAGKAINLFISAITHRAVLSFNMLSDIVSTFTVPATTEKFVAKDKFIQHSSYPRVEDTRVNISLIDKNFSEWFLGKVEEPFSGAVVSGRYLENQYSAGPIIAELGGNEAARTTLTEMWAAMEAQPRGNAGALCGKDCEDYANIFYIEDVNGILREVGAYWSTMGWCLFARSIDEAHELNDPCRIFSHCITGAQDF